MCVLKCVYGKGASCDTQAELEVQRLTGTGYGQSTIRSVTVTNH